MYNLIKLNLQNYKIKELKYIKHVKGRREGFFHSVVSGWSTIPRVTGIAAQLSGNTTDGPGKNCT